MLPVGCGFLFNWGEQAMEEKKDGPPFSVLASN
jgi:hypothetical protein